MQVKKQQLEPNMEKWTGSKLGTEYGKENCQSAYVQYLIQNAGLGEPQARTKVSRRNINNFRYADDATLMAESKEELKSLLMRVKEESETKKTGLKCNIQNTKVMASGPIIA